MELQQTAVQEWIKKRVSAVHNHYSAFDSMRENGHGDTLVDEDTAVQIFCPFHHNVHTMAARYYPRSGGRPAYVRCFKCKKSWDGLNLHAEFKKLRFMDALQSLERRFRIRAPMKPDSPDFKELTDREHGYVSEAWADVPKVVGLMEAKLARLRDRASMSDYVRFCRVLDHVLYDHDKLGKSTPEMVSILIRLKVLMDDAMAITDDMFATESEHGK